MSSFSLKFQIFYLLWLPLNPHFPSLCGYGNINFSEDILSIDRQRTLCKTEDQCRGYSLPESPWNPGC